MFHFFKKIILYRTTKERPSTIFRKVGNSANYYRKILFAASPILFQSEVLKNKNEFDLAYTVKTKIILSTHLYFSESLKIQLKMFSFISFRRYNFKFNLTYCRTRHIS